jgi:TRAP-type C4-dicarboxylate transport system permease small subunit
MGQSLPEIPWMPVGITYLPLPLGAFATMFFIVERMIWGSQHERAVVRFDQETPTEPKAL